MTRSRRLLNAAVCALLALLLAACRAEVLYEASGADKYDKAVIVRDHHVYLDSDLSVFPDRIPDEAADVSYTATLENSAFDIDAVIILRCRYDQARFNAEKSRLSTLSMTVSTREDSYTNYVRYDDGSYRLPAYVTIDGFGSTYEYALIDADALEIVYVYVSYPDQAVFDAYPEYMKKDLSAYADVPLSRAYSMYVHSFDGGASWAEFDD